MKKTTIISNETLIRFAFEKQFTNVNVDALVELCGATANPTIAAEILLGLYKEPVLKPFSANTRENGVGPRKLKGYDKFKQEVSYEYQYRDQDTKYFKTQEDADNKSRDYTWSKSADYCVKAVIDNGIRTMDSTCSLEDWQKQEFSEYIVLEDKGEPSTAVEAVI